MANDGEAYLEANRALWDELVDIHMSSAFYDLEGFKEGRCRLSALEKKEVGDVRGKRLLHLLCHFGLDSLSWARLGADVTGVDFSERAVHAARSLSEECRLPARFVCCEALESARHIRESFDIVFMSWGAFCWISDLDALARMIAGFLKPGGFFYAIDGHPAMLALDESWTPERGRLSLIRDYESGRTPIGYEWGPDYADPDKRPHNDTAYDWAHGLGRIVTGLCRAGLRIDFLHEHEAACWQVLKGMRRRDDGLWAMPEGHGQIPASFSLKALKP
jgi:SAM-dependent methyltransferase